MERREDIRVAMQRLLGSSTRLDDGSEAADARASRPEMTSVCDYENALIISEPLRDVVGGLQEALRENGIAAEPAEIVQAMLSALAVRPSLCRGLLAAYLLNA